MPGMDGIEALRAIKSRRAETQVIMLTGHATLATGTQALREGAFDYLMKPCDTEDLIEKIKEAHAVGDIRRHPVLWPRNRIRDLLLCAYRNLYQDEPLSGALEVFHRKTWRTGVEAAFVEDRQGRLQGLVRKRDLLAEARKAHPAQDLIWSDLISDPGLLPKKCLAEILSSEPVPAARPDERLIEVAGRMMTQNLRCMPVVHQNRVIGIVRMKDILAHIEQETE